MSRDLTIHSVDAYPVRLWKHKRQGALPDFKGPDDPARWHYHGPYAQLAGAIIVVLRTDQGITGFGFGGGGKVAVEIIHGHLRNLLLGTNPLNTGLLWDQLFSAGSYYGRRGVFIMALSGVDNALWDIAGKYASTPVYRMLGREPKRKIEGYNTGHGPKRGLELGFRNIKVSPPRGVSKHASDRQYNVDFFSEARDCIGKDAALMIDCMAYWNDVDYTVAMAERLASLHLYWIEEPLFPDDIDGYSRLVRTIDTTRIASGEHEYTPHGFAELLRRGAVEVLQPDVSWSGGVTALRRIAAMAEAHDLEFSPHRGGSLFGLPLALNSPNCRFAESFGAGDEGTDLMNAMAAPFGEGCYYPSDEPGFGTELSEKLIHEHLT